MWDLRGHGAWGMEIKREREGREVTIRTRQKLEDRKNGYPVGAAFQP